MNCWKSINIHRDMEQKRLNILSVIIAVLSFIIFYLLYTRIHQHSVIIEIGLIPMLVLLGIMPSLHRLVHFFFLKLVSRQMKIAVYFTQWYRPRVKIKGQIRTTKRNLIIALFAPTLLVTLPLLAFAWLISSIFVYCLILASVNIGLSIKDYIQMERLLKAPPHSFVESDGTNLDILISRG
ncbi:metalloprotease family protein [Amphibacillus sediminis]|uniref:metalloprotease family protein n=1 Tax=Amphibacillus sediminis TaxID=360185 RepID=UPI000834F9C5|nr:metalloprotease family protein [Amphibacillus sediminis]